MATTPTYRVEFTTATCGVNFDAFPWNKSAGKPTDENLAKFVELLDDSEIIGAVIVAQANGAVVAEVGV